MLREGQGACVGGLVDRFVERCHIIDIAADSWRQKRAADPAVDGRRELPVRSRAEAAVTDPFGPRPRWRGPEA